VATFECKSVMVIEKPANSTICRLLIFFEIDFSGPDGTRVSPQNCGGTRPSRYCGGPSPQYRGDDPNNTVGAAF
jgi:hypothetical protein